MSDQAQVVTVPKVYAAIAAVMKSISAEGIAKDQKNQTQGYKFRGIDDVYNALSPILAMHKLCVLPRATERTCEERSTKSGSAMFSVTVKVNFTFVCAEDGSWHEVTTYGEAMDSGDKATNKAMSAAFKYACMQAFCIPTEGDNDADAQTHQVQAKPKAAHSATDGAFNALNPIRQAQVLALKEQIVGAASDWDAYSVLSAVILEPDEKVALWELLKPHSKLRASIRALKAEEDKKQAELEGAAQLPMKKLQKKS